jgi:hypothetical protein
MRPHTCVHPAHKPASTRPARLNALNWIACSHACAQELPHLPRRSRRWGTVGPRACAQIRERTHARRTCTPGNKCRAGVGPGDFEGAGSLGRLAQCSPGAPGRRASADSDSDVARDGPARLTRPTLARATTPVAPGRPAPGRLAAQTAAHSDLYSADSYAWRCIAVTVTRTRGRPGLTWAIARSSFAAARSRRDARTER